MPLPTESEWDRVRNAVGELTWAATPYGETEDGDIAAYLLPKGVVHRLVGAMSGVGWPVALRSIGTTTPADQPDEDELLCVHGKPMTEHDDCPDDVLADQGEKP